MRYEIKQRETFSTWLAAMRDQHAKAPILVRLRRAMLGNLGDMRAIGRGLIELRLHIGPGYRIYFVRRGQGQLELLCRGDKSSQGRDIALAYRLLDDSNADQENGTAD